MEFNRNQWFLAGIIVLLLGIQLRYVETFVLNERTTQFLAQRMKDAEFASADMGTSLAASAPIAKKQVTPPAWIGYSLVSFGSVLLLYSLVMKKPGG